MAEGIDPNVEHLPEAEASQLRSLLSEHSDVFAQDDGDLGRTSVVTHVVNTGDQPPIRQPPRRSL